MCVCVSVVITPDLVLRMCASEAGFKNACVRIYSVNNMVGDACGRGGTGRDSISDLVSVDIIKNIIITQIVVGMPPCRMMWFIFPYAHS